MLTPDSIQRTLEKNTIRPSYIKSRFEQNTLRTLQKAPAPIKLRMVFDIFEKFF